MFVGVLGTPQDRLKPFRIKKNRSDKQLVFIYICSRYFFCYGVLNFVLLLLFDWFIEKLYLTLNTKFAVNVTRDST